MLYSLVWIVKYEHRYTYPKCIAIRVSERQKGKGGGQLFQRALLILYVLSLPEALLSNTLKQLNTSTKLDY